MKLPNKIICYKESILSKLPLILNHLQSRKYGIIELYNEVADKTEDVAEFMDILNCLFALGKIEFDENKRSLAYVV
jgi:hypothetical protein